MTAIEPPVRVWDHQRRGRITGQVAWETGKWAAIRLVGDHALNGRAVVDRDGDILWLRKTFLSEVADGRA